MRLHGSNILTREQIDQLIARGLNVVWFPKQLETSYREQYQTEAAHEFRFRAPIILGLYAFLCFGIYQTLPEGQVYQWFSYYGWVGVIVFVAWLLSFVKKLNRYFEYYVCVGSCAAVAITFSMISVLEHGQSSILYHAAMMYAVVIIYGFVGMRFYTAIIAGWLGGFIGIVISNSLNGSIDWTLLNRTYTFSSFLGMALAYATDRQHRENYLQDCIIEHNRLELVQQAQKLSELSQQDALTGLANRRYLDEVLSTEWDRAIHYQTPITVMMVDIDFFKSYNDSLGHIQGDQCLRKIATSIASLVSRSGEIAARYGGEEFLLLFPMTDESEAILHVKRLMDTIKNIEILHPCSQVSPHVTISAGVATIIPEKDSDISQFIAKADHALYLAKSSGRNQFQVAKMSFTVEMI
ncbi:GGDEF domain-containing protein [Acinetobacter sp. S40]|uniref:GGDEF domain-containing protein n=1 Tax=unclassified Acinetobacter TaxID=196816 RepID=UPI00190B2818|nr:MULTISPECIES: GGDEF domain-containing protein [unclassified Acinetobacter]MBJ9984932.1 GGDEF domain-containing protein [Acinetobacter sp. S40]MBK0063077.1 GGDEF domain-containing protein [Acinetobacter sp. S55]MBK0066505.1 GGDEF domain-containing protein [Acinetobacter sp. S54]